jgi:hypothetical protein
MFCNCVSATMFQQRVLSGCFCHNVLIKRFIRGVSQMVLSRVS